MKKDIKIILTIVFIVGVIVGGIFGINAIVNINSNNEIVGEVTLIIRCDTVADQSVDHPNIPADGSIVDRAKVKITAGYTAYDLIKNVTREKGIHTDIETTGFVYIKAVSNIYAGSFGDWSGWIFKFNDSCPNEACNAIVLKDGDKVELLFSRDGGSDLGIVWN